MSQHLNEKQKNFESNQNINNNRNNFISKETRWDRIRKRYANNYNTNSVSLKSETVRKFLAMDFIGEKNEQAFLVDDKNVKTKLDPNLVMDVRHQLLKQVHRNLPIATVAYTKNLDACKAHNETVENRYIDKQLNELRENLEKKYFDAKELKSKYDKKSKIAVKTKIKPLAAQSTELAIIDEEPLKKSFENSAKFVQDFYTTPLEALEKVENLYNYEAEIAVPTLTKTSTATPTPTPTTKTTATTQSKSKAPTTVTATSADAKKSNKTVTGAVCSAPTSKRRPTSYEAPASATYQVFENNIEELAKSLTAPLPRHLLRSPTAATTTTATAAATAVATADDAVTDDLMKAAAAAVDPEVYFKNMREKFKATTDDRDIFKEAWAEMQNLNQNQLFNATELTQPPNFAKTATFSRPTIVDDDAALDHLQNKATTNQIVTTPPTALKKSAFSTRNRQMSATITKTTGVTDKNVKRVSFSAETKKPQKCFSAPSSTNATGTRRQLQPMGKITNKRLNSLTAKKSQRTFSHDELLGTSTEADDSDDDMGKPRVNFDEKFQKLLSQKYDESSAFEIPIIDEREFEDGLHNLKEVKKVTDAYRDAEIEQLIVASNLKKNQKKETISKRAALTAEEKEWRDMDDEDFIRHEALKLKFTIENLKHEIRSEKNAQNSENYNDNNDNEADDLEVKIDRLLERADAGEDVTVKSLFKNVTNQKSGAKKYPLKYSKEQMPVDITELINRTEATQSLLEKARNFEKQKFKPKQPLTITEIFDNTNKNVTKTNKFTAIQSTIAANNKTEKNARAQRSNSNSASSRRQKWHELDNNDDDPKTSYDKSGKTFSTRKITNRTDSFEKSRKTLDSNSSLSIRQKWHELDNNDDDLTTLNDFKTKKSTNKNNNYYKDATNIFDVISTPTAKQNFENWHNDKNNDAMNGIDDSDSTSLNEETLRNLTTKQMSDILKSNDLNAPKINKLNTQILDSDIIDDGLKTDKATKATTKAALKSIAKSSTQTATGNVSNSTAMIPNSLVIDGIDIIELAKASTRAVLQEPPKLNLNKKKVLTQAEMREMVKCGVPLEFTDDRHIFDQTLDYAIKPNINNNIKSKSTKTTYNNNNNLDVKGGIYMMPTQVTSEIDEFEKLDINDNEFFDKLAATNENVRKSTRSNNLADDFDDDEYPSNNNSINYDDVDNDNDIDDSIYYKTPIADEQHEYALGKMTTKKHGKQPAITKKQPNILKQLLQSKDIGDIYGASNDKSTHKEKTKNDVNDDDEDDDIEFNVDQLLQKIRPLLRNQKDDDADDKNDNDKNPMNKNKSTTVKKNEINNKNKPIKSQLILNDSTKFNSPIAKHTTVALTDTLSKNNILNASKIATLDDKSIMSDDELTTAQNSGLLNAKSLKENATTDYCNIKSTIIDSESIISDNNSFNSDIKSMLSYSNSTQMKNKKAGLFSMSLLKNPIEKPNVKDTISYNSNAQVSAATSKSQLVFDSFNKFNEEKSVFERLRAGCDIIANDAACHEFDEDDEISIADRDDDIRPVTEIIITPPAKSNITSSPKFENKKSINMKQATPTRLCLGKTNNKKLNVPSTTTPNITTTTSATTTATSTNKTTFAKRPSTPTLRSTNGITMTATPNIQEIRANNIKALEDAIIITPSNDIKRLINKTDFMDLMTATKFTNHAAADIEIKLTGTANNFKSTTNKNVAFKLKTAEQIEEKMQNLKIKETLKRQERFHDNMIPANSFDELAQFEKISDLDIKELTKKRQNAKKDLQVFKTNRKLQATSTKPNRLQKNDTNKNEDDYMETATQDVATQRQALGLNGECMQHLRMKQNFQKPKVKKVSAGMQTYLEQQQQTIEQQQEMKTGKTPQMSKMKQKKSTTSTKEPKQIPDATSKLNAMAVTIKSDADEISLYSTTTNFQTQLHADAISINSTLLNDQIQNTNDAISTCSGWTNFPKNFVFAKAMDEVALLELRAETERKSTKKTTMALTTTNALASLITKTTTTTTTSTKTTTTTTTQNQSQLSVETKSDDNYSITSITEDEDFSDAESKKKCTYRTPSPLPPTEEMLKPIRAAAIERLEQIRVLNAEEEEMANLVKNQQRRNSITSNNTSADIDSVISDIEEEALMELEMEEREREREQERMRSCGGAEESDYDAYEAQFETKSVCQIIRRPISIDESPRSTDSACIAAMQSVKAETTAQLAQNSTQALTKTTATTIKSVVTNKKPTALKSQLSNKKKALNVKKSNEKQQQPKEKSFESSALIIQHIDVCKRFQATKENAKNSTGDNSTVDDDDNDKTTSTNLEQNLIIQNLFCTSNPAENRELLKNYFKKWMLYTTIEKIERDNVNCKADRIRKINAFLDKIRKEKDKPLDVMKQGNNSMEAENLRQPHGNMHLTKKYQNKIKKQQDIIDEQRIKLQRQERLITELKLNKLSEECKEAREDLKQELKTVLRQGDAKSRTAAKCLQLVGNLRDKEDEDNFTKLQGKALLVPKFMQNMQERALERNVRHEQAKQRRLQKEAELEAQKLAAEEAKRLEDEDFKRARIEALKEKRRQERLAKIEQERQREINKYNNERAKAFHRRTLLKRYFEGFRLMLQRKHEIQQKVSELQLKNYKRKYFDAWRGIYEEILEKKMAKARRLHARQLQRNAFRIWRKETNDTRCKMLVACDWHEMHLTENVFKKWLKYTRESKFLQSKKMKRAAAHFDWQLKWRALDCWRRLPQILKLEKETDERRQRWRSKIWDYIPDYEPNRDNN